LRGGRHDRFDPTPTFPTSALGQSAERPVPDAAPKTASDPLRTLAVCSLYRVAPACQLSAAMLSSGEGSGGCVMIASVVALLLQVGSDASQATSPSNDLVVRPNWLRRPSGQDMVRTFPRGAMRQDLAGQATLQCIVTPAGTLDGCQVNMETPPN